MALIAANYTPPGGNLTNGANTAQTVGILLKSDFSRNAT